MSTKPATARKQRSNRKTKENEALRDYHRKRDFNKTAEPRGDAGRERSGRRVGAQFVIQKHWARRLHYDFRLELDGTLKSWAVPKGPSLDPSVKRMAIQVEDHPLAYGEFEGTIPKGEYGAGKVIVWDRGSWEAEGDAAQAYAEGKLKFRLNGHKLQGRWALIRTGKSAGSDRKSNGGVGKPDDGAASSSDDAGKATWLLIKEKDEFTRAADQFDVTISLPHSVVGVVG